MLALDDVPAPHRRATSDGGSLPALLVLSDGAEHDEHDEKHR
ncbi:MAG TPA: hypothetical protein VGF64_17020 [Acidimicrobiales bacterium]